MKMGIGSTADSDRAAVLSCCSEGEGTVSVSDSTNGSSRIGDAVVRSLDPWMASKFGEGEGIVGASKPRSILSPSGTPIASETPNIEKRRHNKLSSDFGLMM